MRTIQYKVYNYDELSAKAQQLAVDSLRDRIAGTRIESDADDYRNTLEMIEQVFRVKVRDWYIDSCTHFFRFDFVGIDEDIENEPRLFLRYLNTNVLPCIDNKKRYYSKTARVSRKSRILCNKDYSYCLTGCWCDDAVDNALNNINQSIKKQLSAREFVERILADFFKQWQNDYEYSYSDECITEEIEDNNYEFYEDGKPCFA